MLTPDEIKIFSLCDPHLPFCPIIFDVGAYKGAYSDHVLSVSPDARCYVFEPNKDLYLALLHRYLAFNVALSNTKGYKVFYTCLNQADELSSLYKREIFSEVKHEEKNVLAITIDSFCDYSDIGNIAFLKIDVEGAELDVLQGAKNMLKFDAVKFIQVEYGGTYKDAGITFIQVIEFVSRFGYKVYELINDKLSLVTADAFIEDYRFTNFLITRHDFR